MARPTIVVDSCIWKIYPTGRITVYGKGERAARFAWQGGYILGFGIERGAAWAFPARTWSSPSLLTQLETQGHPQTNQSSSLYLALVSMQKRLLTVDPPPPPVSEFVPELVQLVALCEGKLAAIKPFLEEVLRRAR